MLELGCSSRGDQRIEGAALHAGNSAINAHTPHVFEMISAAMKQRTSQRKEWFETWRGPIGVVGGALLLVVPFYWWLWQAAKLDPAPNHLGSKEHIERLGQIGDAFGAVTSFFAMLAFGFSWLTNKSQSKELELQRTWNQAQLQTSQRAAHAQRVQSLRVEAEAYRDFVGQARKALQTIRRWRLLFGH